MNTSTPRILAAAAGAIALGSVCSYTAAQPADDILPIIFWASFEPPAYLAGPLGGQDNWTAAPKYPALRAATVEKGLGQGNSPAVRIDAALLNYISSEWSRPVGYQMYPAFPVLRVEWDAFLVPSKMPSDAWETRLYDPKGGLLCGLQITPDGITYVVTGPDPIPVITPVPLNVWNHFEMRLNFGAATADFFLNGTPLTPSPIPAPGLTPDGSIGTLVFAVLNPGVDITYLDNISIQPRSGVCRANCDQSTQPPILNVADFMCFQKAFIEALELPVKLQITSYANFDGSRSEPVLNVNDYMAYLTAFAGGCR